MVKRKRTYHFIERYSVLAAGFSVIITVFAAYFGKAAYIAAFALCAAVVLIVMRYVKLGFVLIICFVLSLNLAYTLKTVNTLYSQCGTTRNATFVLTEDSVTENKITMLELKCVSDGELPYGTKLESYIYKKARYSAGDIITADVTLSEIPQAQKKSYISDDIYVFGDIDNIKLQNKKNTFYRHLGQLRRYIKGRYRAHLSGDTAELLIAVTMGDKSRVSAMLYDNIRAVGVSHMVAVSGFHLSILLGNMLSLFDKFIKNRYFRFALSLAGIVLVAGACGFSKSVLRAGVMFAVSAAAPLFLREKDSLSSLFISIPIVFLISPFALYSIAFNLSVAATFSIIYVSPVFVKRLTVLPVLHCKAARPFVTIAVNSFFAVIFTMPIIIKVFGTVSVLSVVSNLLLNYIVFVALTSGAAALVISLFSYTLSVPAFFVAGIASKTMIFIINGLAEQPVVSVNMGKTAFYISLAAASAVTAFVYYLQKTERKEVLPRYGARK